MPPDRSAPSYSDAIVVRVVAEPLPTDLEEALTAAVSSYPDVTMTTLVDEGMLLRVEEGSESLEIAPELADRLRRYRVIDASEDPGAVEALLPQLHDSDAVELAYREERVGPAAPSVLADDTHAALQGYLDAAPDGVDARAVWSDTLGCACDGAGVKLANIDLAWNLGHDELPTTSLETPMAASAGESNEEHGTAALGVVAADDDLDGVVGMAPAVGQPVPLFGVETASDVAKAIVLSVGHLDPGDILLLEIEFAYPGIFVEKDPVIFDAIAWAAAVGVVVIEPAGNGNQDVDPLVQQDAAGNPLDSGAIVVGAAESALPHDRFWLDAGTGSSWGSRVDCYAWGEDIVTAGYGDLADAGPLGFADRDFYFTKSFGETSGAAAILAGAAALVQHMALQVHGAKLLPGPLRDLLADPTLGTPQGGGRAGAIGSMPDLKQIWMVGLAQAPDLFVRDSLQDDGQVPSPGGLSRSPDIIVSAQSVAAQATYGAGSGTEGDDGLSVGVVEGEGDHYLYVRMANRMGGAPVGARATVYWSAPATLVQPAAWMDAAHLIGSTDTGARTVAQADGLQVVGPITWEEAKIPGVGHYCFIAIVDHAADPAPPVPDFEAISVISGADTWQLFLDWVRNANNVAWRNFNVIAPPTPGSSASPNPFFFMGAQEGGMHFDLEVLTQGVPDGVVVALEAPLQLLGEQHREAFAAVEVNADRTRLRGIVPPAAALMRRVLLPRARRAPCRIRFGGEAWDPDAGPGEVAVRQVYKGVEVGRVTWRIDPALRRAEEPAWTPLVRRPRQG